MGRAQPDKCRHEIDAFIRLQTHGHGLRFLCRIQDAQGIPEPLDCRTGDKHGTFEGVRDTTVFVAGDGGQ